MSAEIRETPLHHTSRNTLADAPTVFIVKSSLFPVTAVLLLVVCLAIGHESPRGSYFLIAVLTFLGVPEFMGAACVSTVEHKLGPSQTLFDLSVRWFLLIGCIATLLYLSDVSRSLDYRLLFIWSALTPFTLYGAQRAARHWLISSGCEPRKRCVIVGLTESGARLEHRLRADALLRTELIGYFEDRSTERLSVASLAPILGGTRGLPEFAARNNIEQIYITLPMKCDARILALLDSLHDSTASIYFVPDMSAFNLIQARFDTLSGVPIVAVRETPFHGTSWLAKRASDVVIATAALLALLPALVLIALCIRLDSRGPVLFKQKRYGLDGREIIVYKFRSMNVTEDGKEIFTAAARADSRVTRVGGFLRKTSLDELPQLFNVLAGSMSIVGPRPHTVSMNERYRRLIPSYMVRHKIKPGITGWAQVNGQRGGNDLESMRKRVELDIEYLRHWSLWLDAKILLRTVIVIWTDRNAY